MSDALLDLDGTDWVLREALGETWRWYVDAPLGMLHNNVSDAARDAVRTPGWLPATVPGSVVHDLTLAGELPDPYVGRQSRASEWTGTRSWVQRRDVALGELPAGEHRVLELDGVDPEGLVLWDGVELGRTETLYRPARFAVPDSAAGAGTHRLAIVLAPVRPEEPQVGRTERVRQHRPRMNEGWDFCPRFPHQGVWRSVRLVTARTHLSAVQVTSRLSNDGARGVVTAALELDPGHDPSRVRLEVVDLAGELVASADVTALAGSDALTIAAAVTRPRHWSPRRLGSPVTYRVRVLVDEEQQPRWEGTTGFRDARLVRAPGAPEGSLPYCVEVGGRRVPAVGWNWAPAEAQHGATTPERVRHLVDLAARSGALLLRVWGGGLVETEEFYEACDEAGLLVWQEFSQSSSGMQSAPARDDAFIETLRRDAEVLVPRRTHHPSLLIWGGGNELDEGGAPLSDERSPALAALHEVVDRLDGGRAWLPTSPSGPLFHYRPDPQNLESDEHHDVHGPWEHQGLEAQHALYDTATALAHTEFGVEGMANRRSLQHLVAPEDRWPTDRGNPVYRHLGEWWDNAPLVQRSFGGQLRDVDSMLRASQLMQSTGLQYAVEADRRRWPRCSMVLPWQLAESYPNAWCTSVVDHRGDPKPAFHAVSRAFGAERVTLRTATSVWSGRDTLEAELWLWSEPGRPTGTTVTGRLLDLSGTVLAETTWLVPAAVDDPSPVGALRVRADRLPADVMLLWQAVWTEPGGAVIDEELALTSTGPTWEPLLDLPAATVSVELRAAAGPDPDQAVVRVRHRAGPAVVGLTLGDDRPYEAPGWAVVSGDPRPLLPGGERDLSVRWLGARTGRALRIDSWNAGTVRLDLEGLLG